MRSSEPMEEVMTPPSASANLVPMTIRLETAVSLALAAMAEQKGQEVADYAAGVLIEHVLPAIKRNDPAAAKRLQAEMEVKAEAIELAKNLSPARAFDPNVTFKVFQAIRTNNRLQRLYLRAIGDRPGDERGNHIKARINRSLGAAIKIAVDATPKMIGGNPVKVQVTGEFIFSYTLLAPRPGAKLAA
jgi:hypothetical protein